MARKKNKQRETRVQDRIMRWLREQGYEASKHQKDDIIASRREGEPRKRVIQVKAHQDETPNYDALYKAYGQIAASMTHGDATYSVAFAKRLWQRLKNKRGFKDRAKGLAVAFDRRVTVIIVNSGINKEPVEFASITEAMRSEVSDVVPSRADGNANSVRADIQNSDSQPQIKIIGNKKDVGPEGTTYVGRYRRVEYQAVVKDGLLHVQGRPDVAYASLTAAAVKGITKTSVSGKAFWKKLHQGGS